GADRLRVRAEHPHRQTTGCDLVPVRPERLHRRPGDRTSEDPPADDDQPTRGREPLVPEPGGFSGFMSDAWPLTAHPLRPAIGERPCVRTSRERLSLPATPRAGSPRARREEITIPPRALTA